MNKNKLPMELPFIVQDFPTGYEGHKQLAVCKHVVMNAATALYLRAGKDVSGHTNLDEQFLFGICGNILYNPLHSTYKSSFMLFLDISYLDYTLVNDICAEWDEAIPLNSWLDMNDMSKYVPIESWKSYNIGNIHKFIGTLHYYDFSYISKRRKTISKRRRVKHYAQISDSIYQFRTN